MYPCKLFILLLFFFSHLDFCSQNSERFHDAMGSLRLAESQVGTSTNMSNVRVNMYEGSVVVSQDVRRTFAAWKSVKLEVCDHMKFLTYYYSGLSVWLLFWYGPDFTLVSNSLRTEFFLIF